MIACSSITILLIGVHVCLVTAGRVTSPDHIQNSQCQNIDVELCKHFLSYNRTLLPNILGHRNQSDISLELNQFFPVIRRKCSPRIGEFMCSVYFPQCTHDNMKIVPPCRSLCMDVEPKCRQVFEMYGLKWPDILNCNLLPVDKGCYEERASKSWIKNKAITKHYPSTCRRIDTEVCKNALPYRMTRVPNVFWHKTKQEIGNIELYEPFVQMNCSKHLRQFLCSMFLPPCRSNGRLVLPCQSFCLLAMSGCRRLAEKVGFTWPESMDCQRMPESENCFAGTKDGVSHKEAIASSRPDISSKTTSVACEPVTVPVCKDVLPYKMTRVPNGLWHRTQNGIKYFLQEYDFFIQMNCSTHLTQFLCSYHLPECRQDDRLVLPCQSLCHTAMSGCRRLAERNGFRWPESMDCQKMPESGNCFAGTTKGDSHSARNAITTTSRPDASGKPITDPLCKSMSYHRTHFPNIFGHRNHDEAALEIQQYFPLVKVNCSVHLPAFLCSVYFPPIADTAQYTVRPCRSLCYAAENGCAPLMRKYGFNWPVKFICERFPLSGLCFNGDSIVGQDSSQDDEKVIGESSSSETVSASMAPPTSPEPRTDDVNKPTDCIVGEFECRHATSHAHIDGRRMCCFDEKSIYYWSGCRSDESYGLGSWCKCMYPTPYDVPGSC